jgi:N-acetylglucosamine malate deacetylase 1
MRILAVGAHPDDVEINCMGTLARYIKEGHHVTIAHVCTGDKGHVTIPPAELAKIRRQEAQQAAALIGATSLCLEYPDGELYVSDASVRRVTDLIRQVRPDLIITHPTRHGLDSSSTTGPDYHTPAGRLSH